MSILSVNSDAPLSPRNDHSTNNVSFDTPRGGEAESNYSGGNETETVKVFVRVRPLNKKEISEQSSASSAVVWDYNDTGLFEDTATGQRGYIFDRVFPPLLSNRETYEVAARPVVSRLHEGYPGTILAYGQTGSGKRWTVRGLSDSDAGWLALSVRDLLHWGAIHPETSITVIISCFEIINEEINDLLGVPGDSTTRNLRIVADDPSRGLTIGNLTEEVVSSVDGVHQLLARTDEYRLHYISTTSIEKQQSSESTAHTIYRITAISTPREALAEDVLYGGGAATHSTKQACLNIVELAGSERPRQQSSALVKSLATLGNVISRLTEANRKAAHGSKTVYVPFRDSKLTRVLRHTLTGSTSLVRVICNVTLTAKYRDETVRTLKFGQQCKLIKSNRESFPSELPPSGAERGVLKRNASLSKSSQHVHSGISSANSSFNQDLQQHPSDMPARSSSPRSGVVNQTNSGSSNAISGGGSPGITNRQAGGGVDIVRLNDKIAWQQKRIATLEKKLEDIKYLEESKTAIEDHESHSKKELDKHMQRLDTEKRNLHSERIKMLKERSHVEEREVKVGQLLTQLDERESKLQQILSTMRSQEEQWRRCIVDLEKKEAVVEDWHRHHKMREQKLHEADKIQERRFLELNRREKKLAEEEEKMQLAWNDLQEREQRLQLATARTSHAEQTTVALEEKLHAFEGTLIQREKDIALRDEELVFRRKEVETWDNMLREKERKISVELRVLDEREAAVRSCEERARQRDAELERRAAELRQNESAAAEKVGTQQRMINELEHKTILLQEQSREVSAQRDDLTVKENDLVAWERRLMRLQERMSLIDEKEHDLKQKVSKHVQEVAEFQRVVVPKMNAKYGRELAKLESVMIAQMKVIADFQREVEVARAQLGARCSHLVDYDKALEQRNQLVERLKQQLDHMMNDAQAHFPADHTASVLLYGPAKVKSNSVVSGITIPKLELLSTAGEEDIQYDGTPHFSTTPTSGRRPGSSGKRSGGDTPASVMSRDEMAQQVASTQRMLQMIVNKHGNGASPQRSNIAIPLTTTTPPTSTGRPLSNKSSGGFSPFGDAGTASSHRIRSYSPPESPHSSTKRLSGAFSSMRNLHSGVSRNVHEDVPESDRDVRSTRRVSAGNPHSQSFRRSYNSKQ